MPTYTPVGLATQTGVGLTQNPGYSHTWRDFSSTHASMKQHKDMFAVGEIRDTPWISEYTLQLSSPEEYAGRVKAMTLVHTGGNTDIAHITHHTIERPKFPPGSINLGVYTISRYLPTEDPALAELHEVCYQVAPHLDSILESLERYHLHCPKDGWITTAGFVVAAHKGGLHLTRAQLLALERAVPKDTLGRVNYYSIAHLVRHITGHDQQEQQQEEEAA